MDASERCPCGSGRSYSHCCGPLHGGEPASTAEELMRSRFSAYAAGLTRYLLDTWDPTTRPKRLELDATVWRRVQIVDTAGGGPGDTEGVVRFRASYRTADGFGLLEERSRFRRDRDRWVYVDGDVL